MNRTGTPQTRRENEEQKTCKNMFMIANTPPQNCSQTNKQTKNIILSGSRDEGGRLEGNGKYKANAK